MHWHKTHRTLHPVLTCTRVETQSFHPVLGWPVARRQHGAQGVPEHKILPTTGMQHAEAFCQLSRGFTARAVCNGCFSHQSPAVGPRQCVQTCLCNVYHNTPFLPYFCYYFYLF